MVKSTYFGLGAAKESFGRDASDGVNILSGVDMVNAFVDIGKQAMATKEPIQRVTDAKNIGKTKNVGVPYVNMARA